MGVTCTINGESRTVATGTSIAALLDEMRLAGRKVAVEKNGEVVPKSAHSRETLADGDIVEIVGAVGGG